LLALLGAHHILHVSRIRVNKLRTAQAGGITKTNSRNQNIWIKYGQSEKETI
jgi:hypothetical protein